MSKVKRLGGQAAYGMRMSDVKTSLYGTYIKETFTLCSMVNKIIIEPSEDHRVMFWHEREGLGKDKGVEKIKLKYSVRMKIDYRYHSAVTEVTQPKVFSCYMYKNNCWLGNRLHYMLD